MDQFLEGVYLSQVIEDCERFLLAIRKFNDSRIRMLSEDTEDEENDPFEHANSAVHRAAAVSRMFWPPIARDKKKFARSSSRGSHLRLSLGIDDRHPIKSRSLRDHLEHFDERLDEWAQNSKKRSIVKKFIGPRSAISGLEDTDIIHHLDPESPIYCFRGQPFDLQAITHGVIDVLEKSRSRLDQLKQRP